MQLDRDEERRLEQGDVVVRILPADDQQLAVFAAGRLNVAGDRLVAKVRDIAALKRGAYVPAIARFSNPPVLDDLAGLQLDRSDVDGISECRPDDCALKLGIGEIERLRRVIGASGENRDDAVNAEFRQIVLARVHAYLAEGGRGLPAYRDQDPTVLPQAVFANLVESSGYLQDRAPHLANYLEQYPRLPLDGVESFLYWSKETFGWRPVISATHVSILRGDGGPGAPEVLIASRQVFATHYFNGALGLIILVPDEEARRLLVYVHRSSLDVLDGFLSGLRRAIIERRVEDEAKRLFERQRRRLEGTDAPIAHLRR